MADTSFLTWPFFEARHRDFAAALETWCAANLPVTNDDVDAACRVLVAKLGAEGWLDATADPIDVRTLCLARETLARHDGLADFAFAMQGLGTGAISLFGTAEQRRWLARTRRGEAIAAFALSEPQSGSDVADMAMTATRDGDDYVLSGEKTWISNGGIADLYTVFARTGEAPGAKGISAFLVPADAPGLTIAERLEVIAPHPLARLRFDDVRVPASAMIGEPGAGFRIAMATLDVFRATVGAAALGFARRALDESIARAADRRLFGAPLGELQMVQGHIADMALNVDAAALLIYRAAWIKDTGAGRVTREAAMAKLYATDRAQAVIDAAVQLHGGDGVRRGHVVERLYREIRALRIYEGASDVQKVVIARQVMGGSMMLGPSGHIDTFSRDNLPPADQWPDLLLGGFAYPERLNAGVELCDALVERGFGDHIALIGNGRLRTYKELADWSNRIAHALVEDYGVRAGNRVLIRSPNNPAMVACWLAATKAGAVVVNTMPMLRAGELAKIVDKAEIALALCDTRILDEVVACAKDSRFLRQVIGFDGTANHDAELDRIALGKPVRFAAAATGRDDVALLGFTSGTTGEPKATMHFHRDLLIIADGYAREVLGVTPDDVFVGSPPLAFTFGLGGLAIFPLRFGAAAALLEQASPANMVELIELHRATISFTAPTAYRAMLAAMDAGADLSSLRLAVSAGETLPAPVYEEWTAKTGKPILDGIGSTEMLHIFVTNRPNDRVPACTGRPVDGYEARIVGPDMAELPQGEIGALAVRGPTGCRYLADGRQRDYVRDGWNLTGDSFWQDEDGRFHFAARSDDMIVSSGYNIAGPEVEAALLAHPHVAECAVIGAPDEARGQIVEAHVVLVDGAAGDALMVKALQDHVKQAIAPYKYPRSIRFVTALPKTATGKIQRFRLRAAERHQPGAAT